jgi:hypothetical protein
MNKKIKAYYYGNTSTYDEYNPAYVMRKKYSSEILYLIASKDKYSISASEISNLLSGNFGEVEATLKELERIGAISSYEGNYKVNFSIFLEEDLKYAESHFKKHSHVAYLAIQRNLPCIKEKIGNLVHYKLFSPERWLYHVICDHIFDGHAFEYLEKKDLICTTKNQVGQRNYIIYGFEENEFVENFSNQLLCSSNNYKSNKYTFNSFGDSNGDRKDFFRFFKKLAKSNAELTSNESLNNIYLKLNERANKEFTFKSGELLTHILSTDLIYSEFDEVERELIDFLIAFEYIEIIDGICKCKVPVFMPSDEQIILEISEIIMESISDIFSICLVEFENENIELTSFKHEIDRKEVAVEIWHQFFGQLNELLILSEVVALREHKAGEGHYYRSLMIQDK